MPRCPSRPEQAAPDDLDTRQMTCIGPGAIACPAPMSRLDRWGMLVSSICLVHCLALPLLAAFLPFFATALPSDQWVHPLLLALALPLTGTALVRGYLAHRLVGPTLIGLAGLALIATAIFVTGPVAEAALTVTGGLIVASAHILNWRGHRHPH